MSRKIYIGPTIDGVAIRNTVYEELPEQLEKEIRITPYLAGLCIPISSLAAAMKQLDGKEGATYKLYSKALKDSAEIKKGVN